MQKKLSISLIMALASTLGASQISLEPIVVTANKTSQSLQSVTSNVEIITQEELQEKGFLSVERALATLPGIVVLQNGGLGKSSSVNVRGFDSKRVLVLIDGVRYNDPTSLSGANFAHLLTDDVARIEVIKGPQSGIWGADASAGVINIITKRAQKEGVSATLFGEYGSYNTKKYGLNSAFKKGAFDLALDVVRLESDGFSTKVPPNGDVDDFEDDGYENSTLNLRLGYDLSDKDRIEGVFNYIDATNEYDGYNKDPILSANDSESKVDIKEKFYGINYSHNFSNASVKLYANRSDFERLYATGFSKEFKGSVDEYGLNGRIDYAKDGFVTLGMDHKEFSQEDQIDNSYKNQGLFVSNTNEVSGWIDGKTILSESLRYDNFDEFDNKLTYKVGLKHIHQKIEGFWTSFNYATAYNVPTLYQLYDGYAGNSALNPEKTKGWEITANYKGAQITYFDNKVEDMIDYDFATYKYANIAGESTLKGVEFSYGDLLEDLELSYNLNYTYLKAEDQKGQRLPRRAKNSANLSLDYYGIANAHVGALVQYVGKRKKSPYATNPDVDAPSYATVRLNADYSYQKDFTLYLRVENALDKEYQEIPGYASSQRAFYAGFRYQVK